MTKFSCLIALYMLNECEPRVQSKAKFMSCQMVFSSVQGPHQRTQSLVTNTTSLNDVIGKSIKTQEGNHSRTIHTY